jgi:hypothetical protein
VKYGIIWSEAVQEQLANQYLAARLDGREAEFSWAVSEIEMTLARDPWAAGESRVGIQRIVFESPAMVLCQIDDADRTVAVVAVRYVP